jgi:hypothetical protein
MTALAERQAAFLRTILDESAPLPEGWGNSQAAGMAVYRGNYRSALMGALAETYERTALYLGEKPFRQAAINHAIAHPPSGWTIDEAGAGFEATLARMFADNPEVAELGWLEWAMLELATAPDTEALTLMDFAQASAAFADEDWAALRLAFQPRSRVRLVWHDLEAIWRALGKGAPAPETRLDDARTCLAWREGERPTFTLLDPDHAPAFASMKGGANYGELVSLLLGDQKPTPEAVGRAAMRAGEMLGTWLREGLVVGINP